MAANLLEQTRLMREGKATAITKAKKILIFGPAKVGKTALAGTIAKVPGIDRIFWFDLEYGFETIQTLKTAEGDYAFSEEEIAKINLINVVDYPDEPIAAVTILESFSARTPVKICTTHGKINCPICGSNGESVQFNMRSLGSSDAVVIDSGTQLGISALNIGERENETQFLKQSYAKAAPMLNDIFTMIQTSLCHVVMVAHEYELTKEVPTGKKGQTQTIVTDVVPSILSRNYGRNVGKNFGHVLYMTKQAGKFSSISDPLARKELTVGSRSGVDFSEYDKPTLELLYTNIAPDKPKYRPGNGGGLKVNLTAGK